MWAFARVEFGMTWRELGKLSLRQFEALRKQHEQRVMRERARTDVLIEQIARLIAVAGNSSFRGYDPPLRPDDFLPERWTQRNGPVDDEEMTDEEFDEHVAREFAFAAAYQNARPND
jgi:hypothetical protein